MSAMNQTSQITSDIRTWLDANNRARETKDPIDVARSASAMKAVGQWVEHVKRGHAQVRREAIPLMLLIDSMIALGPSVPPLFAAHRPLAHQLVRFLRSMEEEIRVQLGVVTGTPIPERSRAHDVAEDEALSAPLPADERIPQPKLVLS